MDFPVFPISMQISGKNLAMHLKSFWRSILIFMHLHFQLDIFFFFFHTKNFSNLILTKNTERKTLFFSSQTTCGRAELLETNYLGFFFVIFVLSVLFLNLSYFYYFFDVFLFVSLVTFWFLCYLFSLKRFSHHYEEGQIIRNAPDTQMQIAGF